MQFWRLLCVAGVLASALYADSVQVDLYADDSMTPGAFITVLGDVNESLLPSAPEPFPVDSIPITLNADLPLLAANTRYWIGISGAPTDGWSYDADASGIGVANELSDIPGYGVAANDGGAFQMSVTVGTSIVFDSITGEASQGQNCIDQSLTTGCIGGFGSGVGMLYSSFSTTGTGQITDLELVLDSTAATPEPGSSLLIVAGAGVLALLRRQSVLRFPM